MLIALTTVPAKLKRLLMSSIEPCNLWYVPRLGRLQSLQLSAPVSAEEAMTAALLLCSSLRRLRIVDWWLSTSIQVEMSEAEGEEGQQVLHCERSHD